MLILITELCRVARLSYPTVWSRALRGDYGRAVRRGNRLYVAAADLPENLREALESEQATPEEASHVGR